MDKNRENSKYPLEKCLINKGWNEKGMASITIIRKTPFKVWIIGGYLVDLYCLGLKDTYVRHNIDEEKLLTFYRGDTFNCEMEECSIELARQIIYGAIDYAKELGFSPHKEFRRSKKILGARVIEEETFKVNYGYKGKPFYVSGPNDTPEEAKRIIQQLDKWGKKIEE